jgi:hypothetical protein
MGMPKAAVFPEPVCACPMRSRPAIINGITRDWMGVGSVQPARRMAPQVSAWSEKSSNWVGV